jgi:hypothetical protein
MDELGMSVALLAEKVGCSLNVVQRAYDRYSVTWHITEIIAIADALSCSIDYLCGREERRVITAEEVGRVWDAVMSPERFARWSGTRQSSRDSYIELVNACHASPAVVTEEEVGRIWDLCMRHCQAWNMLSNDGHRWTMKFVNACHAYPAEPERDLTEADYAALFDACGGPYKWHKVDGDARARWRDTVARIRRYRPPSRADKLKAAIDLLGTRHPEAVAVLEAARG